MTAIKYATDSKGSASRFPVADAETLSDARTLTNAELKAKQALVLDPGGSNRVVTFPAEEGLDGLHLMVSNAGEEMLSFVNDGGDTILELGPGQHGLFWCNGTTLFAGAMTTAGIVKITETVTYDQFTDGGGASGTFTLTAGSIPVGATVLRTVLTAVTGFAGDSSAVLIVGDGTDTDRYMTGTPSIFATAAGGLDLGAVSGVAYHDTAKSIVLTATSGTDWGSVSAGSLTIEVYLLT